MNLRGEKSILTAGAIILVSAYLSWGSGVVNTCDEASLRAALVGGGLVTFNCDGTLTLSNTVAITNNTTLDASGHSITISGNSAVRLFTVSSNTTFALLTVALVDGLAKGTNGIDGNAGTPGGPGEGGAIYCDGGTVMATDCSFLRCKSQGGQGGTSFFI